MDNYGTHGHVEVKNWLAKHPRFVIHDMTDKLQLAESERTLVR